MEQDDQQSGSGLEHRSDGTERCRTCGRPIEAGGALNPFCSRRCRDVDLNHWFSGSYSISRDIKDADLETMD